MAKGSDRQSAETEECLRATVTEHVRIYVRSLFPTFARPFRIICIIIFMRFCILRILRASVCVLFFYELRARRSHYIYT